MIFLTVGSEIAFDRIVQAVDTWCGNSHRNAVFGQIADPGPDGYRPENFKWKEFVSPDEYRRLYDEAELIIAHAGMGSIITALVKAKPILIMPRRVVLHETRNDHQVATAKIFSKRKGIFVAEDETMVGPMLDKWTVLRGTLKLESVGPHADDRLIKTIRDFIMAGSDTN